MTESTLGESVSFKCNDGGTITIVGGRDDLSQVGIMDGWAVYDNVRITTTADITLDLSGDDYSVIGSLQHITGRKVINFDVSSQTANGTATFWFENLKPEAWYRMEFGGTLAQTASGETAHGQTTPSGILQFDEVYIPNG